MKTSVIKVSSKGQIVLPASLRKIMGIESGDELIVYGDDNSIVLEKIDKKQLEKEFESRVRSIRKKVKAKGITREDLRKVIKGVRESS